MAEDHPFVGVGFNAYRKAFNTYDTADHAYGFDRAVHSTWFGVLSEMGIPGLLLLLTVLLQAAYNCHRVMRRARDDTSREVSRELARALRGSLVVFAVAGTFLNAQYSEMLWHFVCLASAVRWAESGAAVPVAETPAVAAALEPSLMDSIAGASHA
jgi:O-antigen ligase